MSFLIAALALAIPRPFPEDERAFDAAAEAYQSCVNKSAAALADATSEPATAIAEASITRCHLFATELQEKATHVVRISPEEFIANYQDGLKRDAIALVMSQRANLPMVVIPPSAH